MRQGLEAKQRGPSRVLDIWALCPGFAGGEGISRVKRGVGRTGHAGKGNQIQGGNAHGAGVLWMTLS